MNKLMFVLFFWAVVIAACIYAQRDERAFRDCYVYEQLAACDYLEERGNE